MIARYLSEHPEGVLPTGLSFTPSTSTFDDPKDHPEYWSHLKEIKKCTKFVEITGDTGDVVLMHPVSQLPLVRRRRKYFLSDTQLTIYIYFYRRYHYENSDLHS